MRMQALTPPLGPAVEEGLMTVVGVNWLAIPGDADEYYACLLPSLSCFYIMDRNETS